MILIILWDLFSVLTIYGPISIILSTRQYWIYNSEKFVDLPNGLTYITSYYELGTGDIIFLGVIIGKGGMTHEIYTIICCISSIIIGYMITCIHSIIVKRTVPALPSALCIGIIFYIICRLIHPQQMITQFIEKGLYV